jgi:threonine dehydrogenase-like Zn-dependent dehydrogenase
MKAVCWHGANDVRVENVPDPKILNPRDAIVKITSTAICGSDLHLYDGFIPTMEKGDILGHEFMGEVVELGSEVKNVKIGDRVVVPFTISCGNCFFCNRDLWSLCDNSNPNAWMAEKMTGGRGPDACLDAVGMEAHGTGLDALYDKAKQAVRLETDRPTALRQMLVACRKGGKVSIAGVYGGFLDKIPMGAAFNKGLSFKMGQTHVHRYLKPLLEHIQNGKIDPSFVITHKMDLADAPKGYEIFKNKKDNCIKVVLKP